MTDYFSTFISGFGEVVEAELRKMAGVQIKTILDGLVVYEADLPPKQIAKLQMFNSTFVLLSRGVTVQEVLRKVDLSRIKDINGFRFMRTFRVVFSKENQTTPPERDTLSYVEHAISKTLGLRVHKTKPDIEFWLLTRSEGMVFLEQSFFQWVEREKNLKRES